MSDEHRIFIGICNTQDTVPSMFFWSFVNLRTKWPLSAYRSMHPWDVIRNNVIIDKFLKSDCTILAKMDIDQWFPPDYFERLVPLVDEYKVVGPMIYDRWEQNDYTPLAFESRSKNGFIPFDPFKLNGITAIPYPHTNLLYAREVLEKIPPPWYEAYQTTSGLERANHVDYDFLDKIHNVGYDIYIDTDLIVGHKASIFIDRKFKTRWDKGNDSINETVYQPGN